jgi:UDP:flavonoid glycosyltransferase YjiC (YdhE family)
VWATNVASELDRSPANVVAADHLLPGALAAAEARRIPSVALVHGMYKHRSAPGLPPPGMGFLPARGPVGVARDAVYKAMMEYLYRRDALPSLNVARKQLGLQPLRSAFQQYDRAARVLILCSPELDFRSFHLPSNVRYVGTPLDDFHAPAWTGPWPRDDNRPLVLASLSTLAQGQTDLMQRVLTALGSLRVRALATLGPSLDPSQFQAPANVIVEPFVPHSAVLPNADAMVSQCGIGTLMKALAYGVPLVCLPLIGDQPDNAARVVARGAGIRLGKDASPAQIARAVEHVLSVRTLRDNARRLGSLLDCENAVTRAVNELEWAADGMTNLRHDSRCELVHRRVAALGAKM